MKNSLIESAQQKLISDLELGYEYVNEKLPGDWKVENGELYIGDVKFNGDFDIVIQVG